MGSRGRNSGLPGAGRSWWRRWQPGGTARRSREFELATRLAAIVESSADSIVSATLDGVVMTWNAAAERMYGWTAQEIIGQSTSLLIPPDMAAELMPVFQRVRQGETVEPFETRLLRKDGSIIEVWLADSPDVSVENGGYFVDKRRTLPSAEAQDPEAAKRLWEVSRRQVSDPRAERT